MPYEKEHICEACKKPFVSRAHHGRFCPVCRENRKKDYNVEYQRTHKAEKRVEKKKAKKPSTINDVVVSAKKAGMTYGQYVASLQKSGKY